MECALVELTHEAVGAVVVSQQVWGTKHTQYITVDDVGERFQKQHFDDQLGWHETTVSRRTVRDELITHLTRSASPTAERERDVSASELATFAVKPVQEFQTT